MRDIIVKRQIRKNFSKCRRLIISHISNSKREKKIEKSKKQKYVRIIGAVFLIIVSYISGADKIISIAETWYYAAQNNITTLLLSTSSLRRSIARKKVDSIYGRAVEIEEAFRIDLNHDGSPNDLAVVLSAVYDPDGAPKTRSLLLLLKDGWGHKFAGALRAPKQGTSFYAFEGYILREDCGRDSCTASIFARENRKLRLLVKEQGFLPEVKNIIRNVKSPNSVYFFGKQSTYKIDYISDDGIHKVTILEPDQNNADMLHVLSSDNGYKFDEETLSNDNKTIFIQTYARIIIPSSCTTKGFLTSTELNGAYVMDIKSEKKYICCSSDKEKNASCENIDNGKTEEYIDVFEVQSDW
ncbi:MAG: hypothetical protein GY755_06715 [Chloroflexi bacterium]|nr:hypothetical protein [Chloroflexota bacterium]